MPGKPTLAEVVTQEQCELVFALVGPTGTDFDSFHSVFTDLLRQFRYDTNAIKLSGLAERLQTAELGVTISDESEYERIDTRMTLGNTLRRTAGRGDVLALHAVSTISALRTDEAPLNRTAHLLRSLKHPDEVDALRRVYGTAFFLIGIYSPEAKRLMYLRDRKGMTQDQATRLIARDRDEPDDPFGQHTRETFQLADVFITEDHPTELSRFVELVFGHPHHTPTPDEHAMFLAYAASLRSGQLARQVGAVVVSASDEVIGIGTNDVPKFGGGLYGPGDADWRDHILGEDTNDRAIAELVEDAVKSLQPILPPEKEAAVRTCLAESRIGDVTEFGRSVHAEMEALLSCARSGISVRGGTLYTTTFPCHNCARHIVAAGITKVLYVEPYPKSRAPELHQDSIAVDEPDVRQKVQFIPFVGIAARRYFDLFSLRLSSGLPLERKMGGKVVPWSRSDAVPRIRPSPYSYIGREREAVALIEKTVTAMTAAKPSTNDGGAGEAKGT